MQIGAELIRVNAAAAARRSKALKAAQPKKEAQHMKHIIFANRLDDLQSAVSKYAKKAQRANVSKIYRLQGES